MKNVFLKALATASLLTPGVIEAQGTLYLSNLGSAPTGTQAIGSDSWLAEDIITGANPAGYILNSIQLGMTVASGSPAGFGVWLYSEYPDPNASFPGTSLANLSGSASPSSPGVYTYTPSANLVLSPDTIYWIMLTSTTPVANGAYTWIEGTWPASSVGGWGGLNGIVRSGNGGFPWSVVGEEGEVSLYATAIPEPNSLGVFVLGGLLLLRRRRSVSTMRQPR